ncbi:MAG: AAA family ATPase [Planctomycetes bacterium]|nr:AAA family ATPase [Planctomycetota bacterium]
MPIARVTIANYRSIRDLRLPLARVTVLLGANGCGKTNCYRALRLMHAAAAGRLAETFAEEGGMPSALWAGRRKQHETVRMSVGVEFERYSYSLACGLPTPKAYGLPNDMRRSMFLLDPEVKEEDITVRIEGVARPVPMCQRRHQAVTMRDPDGRRETIGDPLDVGESVLAQIADPSRYGELTLVRRFLLDWRFYHQFRTDAQSPLRESRLGIRSPVLASDGLNLAAALQTIVEIGGHPDVLDEAIDGAFPGARLRVLRDEAGRMELEYSQPGVQRAFSARELSDGTLRFLCLTAALLTPRPPVFLVLNEPETSLHRDLLPALAGMITRAGARGQVLVTTHDDGLARRLAEDGAEIHRLEKNDEKGTRLVGATDLD